jgi:cell division protein ZapA (FtsZ GTPase activity inhibitor)
MDKISLKIIIAGRTYPLTIKKEEEAAILDAAERINSNIKKLQANNGSSSTTTSSQPDFSEDIIKIIEKVDAAL